MTLLPEIDFGSFLTYSPKGTSEEAEKSRNVTYALKQDRPVKSDGTLSTEFVISKIKEQLAKLPFQNYFSPDTFLIPVPKSSLMQKDTLWVPKRLVKQMEKAGLGVEFDCLQREYAIFKAAYSASSDRPKAADHFNSITIRSSIEVPKRIVLVDDIVTSGAALLGCASKIKKAYPNAQIQAFAIIRTISNPEEFTNIEKPCVGTIKLLGNTTSRNP